LIVIALLLGLAVGYVNLHNNEVQPPLTLMLVSTISLGIAQPKRAWLWAILVGMWIPLAPVLARLVGNINEPITDPVRTGLSLLPVLIPSFMGAYFGALLSRAFRTPSHPPNEVS
jgi:hypothetical protein